MTTDYREQVNALLALASLLPDDPSMVGVLEEAIRLADMHQDAPLADKAREKFIHTATFAGCPEKALVAFSWRLAQSDRDPQRFPERELLWQYKWIADSLLNFPQITRRQIEETIEDMARRYQRSGRGLRAVYKIRLQAALDMGEKDRAREAYRLWEKTPRDASTDCAACEQDDRVEYHLFLGKKDKALMLAEPILRGSLRCATIPEATYARVLLPLLQLGQVDKAAEYHRKGYRLIRERRNLLDHVGDHLAFLALTDNLPQGVKLFEKHLAWSLESKDLSCCWRFYLGVHLLFLRLTEMGRTTLRLRLPKTTPGYQEEGRYDVSALAAWIEETCRDLAQRFDARNGNDSFTRRLAANRRLQRWLTPYPLRQPRKASETD